MSSATTGPLRPMTPANWSHYLHRRVMRLLLRHDQQLFRGQFRLFYTRSTLPKHPLLQLYDSYLTLLLLKDELLDDILPRINRQLSLQSSQIFRQEEAPTRGEIDWPRTISRSLNETPDQPTLHFETNQQQRSMLTPENLFVVALLLSYHQSLQDILKRDLSDETLSDQERQQLIETAERIERELATPHLKDLLTEGRSVDLETLAEQVHRQLPPGQSAYRDLFHWWELFNGLRIGKALERSQLTLTSKRSNEQGDAWLYELWLVLELLDLLSEQHYVNPAEIELGTDHMRFPINWNGKRVTFTYQRVSPTEVARDKSVPGWRNLPATQPRFCIEREQPLEVRVESRLIWREPPIVLESYYENLVGEQTYAPSLHHLLGVMRVQQAHHGVLFAPMLPEPAPGEAYGLVGRTTTAYTEGMGHNLAEPVIRLCKLIPGMEASALRVRFKTLLDDVTGGKVLPERPEPACHGIRLDEDTINASRSRPTSYNMLCPKPHIGPGVFDLVHDRLHCLKDPQLCHIYGQAKLAPLVVRPVTQDDLRTQSSDLRNSANQVLRQAENQGDHDKAEQLRSHIFLSMGRMVEQYVRQRGNTIALEAQLEERVFGEYWKTHNRCLAEETRNILLSGEYVWNEYLQTQGLNDWAPAAVQYCRALESEIKRRIHDYYPDSKVIYPGDLKGFNVPHNDMTLGAVAFICSYKDQDSQSAANGDERAKIRLAQHNWRLCEIVANNSGYKPDDLNAILQCIETDSVASNRNKLAHREKIPQSVAKELRDAIIGNRNKEGILYRLVEHLEPA